MHGDGFGCLHTEDISGHKIEGLPFLRKNTRRCTYAPQDAAVNSKGKFPIIDRTKWRRTHPEGEGACRNTRILVFVHNCNKVFFRSPLGGPLLSELLKSLQRYNIFFDIHKTLVAKNVFFIRFREQGRAAAHDFVVAHVEKKL